MRERGLSKELMVRVKKLVRETRSRIKIGGKVGESFWTARKVRQRCPLSPLLFNILVANLEEEMGKVKLGEVRLQGNLYAVICRRHSTEDSG